MKSKPVSRARAGRLGGPGRVARGPKQNGHVTIFPLPARPANELTAQHRREAIEATYSGYLQDAIDLYRSCVTEDGWQSGILRTMADGILGLPQSFQGDPEMCSALLDADGTPGDYGKMHPESECGQIFADGIATNVGLGQYVLMCWWCERTGVNAEMVCEGCGRSQLDRPAGQRKLYRLEWRDPRWLWRNTVSQQWRFTGQMAQVDVNPGDGEWFMFSPYPDVDAWRHGPWLYMTLAAIFGRDAVYDRQRTSEVTSPTPVIRAEGPTLPATREEVDRQFREACRDRHITLPENWRYEIITANYQYTEVAAAIVEWATSMVEVGLTGNLMGMKAQSAFTDAGIYKRTTTERRRFYAKAWTRAIMSQGLRWWGVDNYGSRNVPIPFYDVESPEDKLAALKAFEQAGATFAAMAEGYERVGFELDPQWIQEHSQRLGIRVRPKVRVGTEPVRIGAQDQSAEQEYEAILDDMAGVETPAARLARRKEAHHAAS